MAVEVPTKLQRGGLSENKSISGTISPRKKSSPKPPRSPYINTNNIDLLSRMTEKRFMQRKSKKNNIQNLEVEQVYKVNSHQFTKTGNKKQNKSVLTLPHEQAPIPKPCTVSDMTESEYLCDGERLEQKAKRTVYSKRSKPRNKRNEYTRMGCSSIETIKLGKKGKGKLSPKVSNEKETNDFSNIWSAVRSMNKLQFQNSPNISFESDVTTKHTKINTFNKRRKKHRQNNRFYESYETEEMLCFTVENIPNNNKTLTASQNSSNDKIAVIREIDKFCSKPNSAKKSSHTEEEKNINKNKIESTVKPITNKRSNQASLYKKKPMNKSHTRNKQPNNNNLTYDFCDNDSFDSSGYIKNRFNNAVLPPKSDKSKITVGLPPSINIIHTLDPDPTKFKSNINVNEKRINSITLGKRGIKPSQKVLNQNDDILFLINKLKKDQKTEKNTTNYDLKNKKCFSNRILYGNQNSDAKKKDRFYDCLDIFVDSQKNNVSKPTLLKRQRCRSPTILEEIEDSVQGGIDSECNNTKYKKLFEPNKNEQVYVQTQHNLPGCTIKLKYDKNVTTVNNNKKNPNKRFPFIEKKEIVKNKEFGEQALVNEITCFEFPQRQNDKKIQNRSHIKRDNRIMSPKALTPPRNVINTEDFQKSKERNTSVRNKPSKRKYLSKYGRQYNLDIKESSNSIKSPKVMICNKSKYNNVDTSVVLNQKLNLADELQPKKTNPEELRTFAYLKDKMVKMLSTNISSNSISNDEKTKKLQEMYTCDDKTEECRLDNTVQQVNVRTSTSFTLLCCTKACPDETSKNDNSIFESNNDKAIWSKRKWASDFIDHVILKLKNGFYYTYEKQKKVSTEDVSVQTRLTFDREKLEKLNEMQLRGKKIQATDKSSKYMDMVLCEPHNDPLKSLLGWDNVLAKMEVDLPNINQIEIKHSKTNVLVRFDVTMVSDRKPSNLPCIEFFTPCANINSQTQVFKCKTIIVNRMVPASICSLIPILIKNIMLTKIKTESDFSKVRSILPIEDKKTTSQAKSPKLLGKYSFHILKPQVRKVIVFDEYHSTWTDCIEILPKPTKIFVTNAFSDLRYWNHKRNGRQISSSPLTASMVITGDEICTTTSNFVQPCYKINDNFANTVRNVTIRKIFSEFTNLQTHYISDTNFHIRISFSNQDITKVMTVDMCKGFLDKTPKAIISLSGDGELKPENLAAIEHNDTKSIRHCKQKKFHKNKHHHFTSVFHKVKSRFKVEKCKSNISENKSNISLNDINSLQDFFNIFVNDKMLATIIDSATENKIINCVSEFKNFNTEITPEQAFLIFLLANKKETISLIRLRTILKAIAVKKITNSHELDMAIQVVENEKLDIQDEGTSLDKNEMPNGLLEELYLIAKTTAADFNKPFDVSPETLLSTLLAKRKTLNPSYLRVMARYVGLGLMKLPKTQ